MADPIILYVIRDSIVRAPNLGSGQDPHNTAGTSAGEEERSLLAFQALPAGLTAAQLASAFFYMHRSSGTPPKGHDTPDLHAQVITGLITQDWQEGGKGANHFYYPSNATVWPGPGVTGELAARGDQPASGWWKVSVIEHVLSWIAGTAQRGIRVRGATAADIVFDSVQGAAQYKPYIELTLGSGATSGGGGGGGGGGGTTTVNRPPAAPSNLVAVPGSDGQSFTVTAVHSDPDGDTSTSSEAIFTPSTT